MKAVKRTAIISYMHSIMFPLTVFPAIAQETSALAIEEVVITARRREERLRDVPDAVVALSASDIERSGVRDMNGVADLIPNFNIVPGQQPGTETINIRGIGQVRNGEPPVAVIIDGVQLSSGYQITQELFDVERIEVLKGPQGAVYGRNAIAGAINITTREPTNEFSGGLRVSHGTGNDWRGSGFLSGAIIEDRLLFRASGSIRNFDGDIRNETLNKRVNFDESESLRLRLIGHLTENLRADLRYSKLSQTSGAAWYTLVPPEASINEILPVTANVLGRAKRDLTDTSVKIDWETPLATFSSITVYSEVDATILQDFDFFPFDFVEAEQPMTHKAWSQEFRLVSNHEGPLEWLLGAYYLNTDRTLDSEIYFMPGAGGVLVPFPIPQRTLFSATRATDDNEAYAAFGQIAYQLSERLELTAALRYDIDDRKTIDRVTGETFDQSFKAWQPKFQGSYTFSDDLMAYLSVGRGFRSGGFNSDGRITRVFDKETNWNYEVGTKAALLGNKLLFNSALFYTEITDGQVYNLDLATAAQVISNPVGKASVVGFEADTTFRPTQALELQASIGLMRTKIKDYDETLYTGLPVEGDFTGNRLSRSPESSVALAAQYIFTPVNEIEVAARAEVNSFGGNFYWEIDNRDKRKRITLVNARLTATYRAFSVALFSENLLDEEYTLEYVSQAFSGSPFGNYSLPAWGRRVGVQLQVGF